MRRPAPRMIALALCAVSSACGGSTATQRADGARVPTVPTVPTLPAAASLCTSLPSPPPNAVDEQADDVPVLDEHDLAAVCRAIDGAPSPFPMRLVGLRHPRAESGNVERDRIGAMLRGVDAPRVTQLLDLRAEDDRWVLRRTSMRVDGAPADPEAVDWAWLIARHPEVARFQRAAVLRQAFDDWLSRAREGPVFDASCDALVIDRPGPTLVHRRITEQKTPERRSVSMTRMNLGPHAITTTWSSGDEVLNDGAWQKSANEQGFGWSGSGMAGRAELVVARVTEDAVFRADAAYTLAVDCASDSCTLRPKTAAGEDGLDFSTEDPAPPTTEPPAVRRTRAIVAGLTVVDPQGPSRPWLFRTEAACRAAQAAAAGAP